MRLCIRVVVWFVCFVVTVTVVCLRSFLVRVGFVVYFICVLPENCLSAGGICSLFYLCFT